MSKYTKMLPGVLILGLSTAFILGYGDFEDVVVVLLTVLIFSDHTINVNFTAGGSDE